MAQEEAERSSARLSEKGSPTCRETERRAGLGWAGGRALGLGRAAWPARAERRARGGAAPPSRAERGAASSPALCLPAPARSVQPGRAAAEKLPFLSSFDFKSFVRQTARGQAGVGGQACPNTGKGSPPSPARSGRRRRGIPAELNREAQLGSRGT